jgi:pimeloyl-ACP methyl ester carboxylesterase
MINRIHLIDEKIPIYFLHGEQSWIPIESSLIIQKQRSNVFIDTIKDAGHHVSHFYQQQKKDRYLFSFVDLCRCINRI